MAISEFSPQTTVAHRTMEVDGLKMFYREAGAEGSPKLVLYHGFPGSSAYYRNLIPLLADKFHIIAPDYIGFGNSDKPDAANYNYTFDDAASKVEKLLEAKGFARAGMYMQDYGGPVGFRIVQKHPDWLEWLIIQNTNAYEEGFTEVWDGLRSAYWVNKSPETEKPLEAFLEPDTVKSLYQHGHPKPELVSPDAWQNDLHHLHDDNSKRIQLDFFYDYRTNVELYPAWQKFLADNKPKTQIFWGKGDIFFTPQGGEAYLQVVPDADFHWLDSGHFAVEDCGDYIAAQMRKFYDANVV